eukprot:Sspe_Gene.95990::Locus_68377_Transcript_1_1_Confidence_1.000_Length_1417::g.95990::m.95990
MPGLLGVGPSAATSHPSCLFHIYRHPLGEGSQALSDTTTSRQQRGGESAHGLGGKNFGAFLGCGVASQRWLRATAGTRRHGLKYPSGSLAAPAAACAAASVLTPS